MGSYRCTACRYTDLPDMRELAVSLVGPAWWAPASLPEAQAMALIHARKTGHCPKHCTLIGELFAMRIRAEARDRAVVPGVVLIRHVPITDAPFERVLGKRASAAVEATAERMRTFLAGAPLSARIDYDPKARRIRCEVTLHHQRGEFSQVLNTTRLEGVTAAEIANVLADRLHGNR